MRALARVLLAGADRFEGAAAVIRRIGLETSRPVAVARVLDAVAAQRRQAALDVRRRVRAARDEQGRAVPRAHELPACGREWRTWSPTQVAAATARYRLEQLRTAGDGSWGVAGVAVGGLRTEIQRRARGVQRQTAFVKAVSDTETRLATDGLAWMDTRGRAVGASLPGPLRPTAKILGSGVSGAARATAGGIVGMQAIFAANADGLGRLGVAGAHADLDQATDIGRDLVEHDGTYAVGAVIALSHTAHVVQSLNPTNPLAVAGFYTDVRDKGLTNALADDARAVGEEVPAAGLMLIGEPPTVVAKTAVTVGEAGAFRHGDEKLKRGQRSGR
ncbi:MAG: hypothetical protein JWL73_3389 [Actinomycetia bacterium]|nr:hypothetical protein [Actinomycetes bacterium]